MDFLCECPVEHEIPFYQGMVPMRQLIGCRPATVSQCTICHASFRDEASLVSQADPDNDSTYIYLHLGHVCTICGVCWNTWEDKVSDDTDREVQRILREERQANPKTKRTVAAMSTHS